MSFNTGLSGIRAAASELNVTGNNIANAGTVGFKGSRAEFADVYAASVLGTGSNAMGSGVITGDVAQLFNQGGINYTENSLDLAINGNGFFVTSNNGALSYTRAGYFGTDNQGNIVNNFGERLQGYGVNEASGEIQGGVPKDLKINTRAAEPNATTVVNSTLNLNSKDLPPAGNPEFLPSDSSTYNSSTSVNVFDSLGNPHVLTKYFVKTGGAEWDMHLQIDGEMIGTEKLEFSDTGKLTSGTKTEITLEGLATGAKDLKFDLNLENSTQYAASFAVTAVAQDGYTTGDLAGLEINDEGLMVARYTNGQTKVQGQLALATFANQQGLTPVGKTGWAQSSESGEPVIGKAGSGTLGRVQSGALEQSNVDLSEQLINLIVAQRNYQANSKTIQTEDAVTQTIINLR
ncbi:flagellar hook protein FlgE [Pseudomonas profundi]|uniref:flagellar hook protein FlgE n=1 Tax=Pseudomonas profundi TaxID=1981513 RepID=UPI00123C6F09|nr:flagellar hook protein FlgE [Pseudomonas profundi]